MYENLAAMDDIGDRTLRLRAPNGELLRNGDVIATITFYGRDTSQHAAARNKMLNQNRKLAMTPPISVQAEEEAYLVFLGEITKGWTGLADGGKAIEFNAKAATALYVRVKWIRRSIDQFLFGSMREDFSDRAA